MFPAQSYQWFVIRFQYEMSSEWILPKLSVHQVVQNANESILEHANRLKHLAVHCNFGNSLPRALRDQFVGGVRNPTTKTKLLSEDRTFDRAVQTAIADEAAQKEVKLLQTHPATHSAKVNYAKGKQFQRNSKDNKGNNTRNVSATERRSCKSCKSMQIHQIYLSLLPQGRALTKNVSKEKT